MTPQKQTVFGEGLGNCWATSLAMILDIPVSEVPNFCGDPPRNNNWWEDTWNWLSKRGFEIYSHGMDYDVPADSLNYIIIVGKSPRGDFYHCVVGDRSFNIIEDPHPDNKGLDNKKYYCILRRKTD